MSNQKHWKQYDSEGNEVKIPFNEMNEEHLIKSFIKSMNRKDHHEKEKNKHEDLEAFWGELSGSLEQELRERHIVDKAYFKLLSPKGNIKVTKAKESKNS